jgi:[protein-PII] uridylyltransferase
MMVLSARDRFMSFRESMPWHYREAFDGYSIGEHAAIVERRGQRPVHVELWRSLARGEVVVCVVADDRPGLLSLISAALVAHALDITSARCQTRTSLAARAEAIDLIWLRRVGDASPIRAEDIDAVAQTLLALVTGTATVGPALARASRPPPAPATVPTRLRFAEGLVPGSVVMTVETPDRPGLLLTITHALFMAGVQILDSDASTRDGQALDRFTIVEINGSPLGDARQAELRATVLAAVGAAGGSVAA